MKNNLYAIGAGGHLRSLMALAENNQHSILGIFDETFQPGETELINDVPLLGDLTAIQETMVFLLAIGNNQKRAKLYHQYFDRILKENLIHTSATIEKRAELGVSNQVFTGVFINANARIGENNILNSKALIEHEVVVGNHNHLSIGTIVGGRSSIGNQCFIGAGAVIIDKISICDYVTIGANSLVIRDITQPGIYVGNPVKKIK
jgi:sugar O-acyltransferase (sialic acid O-acetyltransferase NeuD family)